HFIPDHEFSVRSELAPTVRPLSGLQKMPAGVKNARFFGNFFEGLKMKILTFRDFPGGYTWKAICVPNFKSLTHLESDLSQTWSEPTSGSSLLRSAKEGRYKEMSIQVLIKWS
ncbi:hypothetical protein J6590_092726, partial [Homalodisca vitripennis]